jgi:hypothetical protein
MNNNNNIWKTSINELISIFRESLNSVIPSMEKGKIPWRKGESYDEWDDISHSLYKALIKTNLYKELEKSNLVNYDGYYENYSKYDYLLVKSKVYLDNSLVFYNFISKNEPHDYLEAMVIDKYENSIEILELKYENLDFSFVKKNGLNIEIITELEIDLDE